MSSPHPDMRIKMFEDMLKRNYDFHIGDIVLLKDNDNEYDFLTIKSPYFYSIDGEQSYLIEDSAIPFKKSELILVGKNPNGEKMTIEYLENMIKKCKSKKYRENYKPI